MHIQRQKELTEAIFGDYHRFNLIPLLGAGSEKAEERFQNCLYTITAL